MADNRIAYGLAKKYGIDTKDMSPKEVWDALREKGITEKNAEDRYSSAGTENTHGKTHGATPAEAERLKALGIKDSKKNNNENLSAEDRRLKELGIDENNTDDKKFFSSDSKTFYKTISTAKESNPPETRWRVDVHNETDYDNDKLYITKGGSCVAVEPNGNIISVCKNQSDSNAYGNELIKQAIENGGDRLDAFGEGLYKFYTKNGFEPISYTLFDEEYAPEGWEKDRDDKEPVIFYRYTGKRTTLSYDEFINKTNPSKDYDAAMKIRDGVISK